MLVRKGGYSRDDVVVVSAPEVLVLQGDSVVDLGIKVLSAVLVEDPAAGRAARGRSSGGWNAYGNGINARQCGKTRTVSARFAFVDEAALTPFLENNTN